MRGDVVMSEKEPKRFEDWEEVDCNECERYWLNQCDGAKTLGKGSNLPCTSFLATRKVVIPLQIKALQNENKSVTKCIVLLSLIELIHILIHLFGG